MSNIRQVQWNEGAPEKLEPGMLVLLSDYGDDGEPGMVLIGCDIPADAQWIVDEFCIKWGRLVEQHELDWLADMASRKTRTQE